MNNFLAISLTTLIFYFTGFPYSFLIGSQNIIEHLSLSFLIGSGLSTFFWFLTYRFGFPFTLTSFFATSIIVIILGFVLAKIFNQKLRFTKLTFTHKDKYYIFGIITFVLFTLLVSAYNPITAWDSLTMYDIRGKIIALEQNLTTIESNAYLLSYPLMTSLFHAIVYLFKGTNPQPLYPLFHFSLIGIIFSRLKSWTNQQTALIASILLLTNHSLFTLATIAYSNIPYTVFLVSGFLYTLNLGKSKQSANLILAGLLFSLSTWVRFSEIFWLIGIFMLLWQGIRFKKKIFSFWTALLILLFRFTWSSYYLPILSRLNYHPNSLASLISFNSIKIIISNLSDINYYIQQNLLYPYFGSFLLILAFIITFINLPTIRLLQLVIILVLSCLMTLVGIAIFSTYYQTWDSIGDSAQRMIVFLIPLVVTTALYLHYQSKRHEK